jgi:plasmid stabilization system protein ParE
MADACRWYDEQRSGLGREFLEELAQTLARIAQNPQQYGVHFRNARAARLRRFPYVVHYVFTSVDGPVIVVAVMHGSRDPKRLRDRLEESDT